MSPLVSMLFRTFLNTLKFLMEMINSSIYISVPVNLQHLNCAIASSSSLAHKTTTSSTSMEFVANLHFNALDCSYIFAGIVYCSVGGLRGSCQSAILAYVILPAWPRPLHCMHSRGGGGGSIYKSAPHWVRSWASPNRRVAIEKQAHAMVKTNKLYSAYCPTGGCTHHPFSCGVL